MYLLLAKRQWGNNFNNNNAGGGFGNNFNNNNAGFGKRDVEIQERGIII
jgi:hypothetical protein